MILASSPATASHFIKALTEGLAELGWTEKRNLRLDVRFGNNDQSTFSALAAELLNLKPDVFVAGNEPVALAVAALTKTVPIVVPVGFDLVASGLIRSLAKPGGNVTGYSTLTYELMPKRLQLLKEATPKMTRFAILYRPDAPYATLTLNALAEATKVLRLTMIPIEVRDVGALGQAFAQVVKQKAGGILFAPDAFFFQHRAQLAELALEHRLAAGANNLESVTAGFLFAYGAEFPAVFRRSAALVDKILKGANPANMPVEQVNVYELALNRKTARTLGIQLPDSFLVQVTQTIE